LASPTVKSVANTEGKANNKTKKEATIDVFMLIIINSL
jgi:hypothetical protein